MTGSVVQGQEVPFTLTLEKKYVLAMGGRSLNNALDYDLIFRHYSISQWEGLFKCLGPVNTAADLGDELSLEDLQAS